MLKLSEDSSHNVLSVSETEASGSLFSPAGVLTLWVFWTETQRPTVIPQVV